MRSLLLPAAIAATIATVSAASADAQRRASPSSPSREQLGQLNARLDSAARSIAGYRRASSGHFGRLVDDSSETSMEYGMAANGRYALVGVCIDGCTNLNLRVLKPDGSLLVEETRAGSAASLELTAPAAGVYKLVARMEACPQGSCFYEIRLLRAS